jgi:hypothetical protein
MRTNSGSGKSNNNLRDPTMKESEHEHRKGKRVQPSDRDLLDETSDA